jgi:lipopolysaccharide export system protein LptA
MRGTRWLLLVAIAAILIFVGASYRAQRRALRNQSPPRPEALPPDTSSAAKDYHFFNKDGKNCKTVEIWAGDERQASDSSHVDLKDVTMRIYHNCEKTYDLAKSAAATYYPSEHRLYSEGAVEIIRGVPVEGEPAHTLLSIKSSGGVNFDTDSSRAETDRPSTFTFQNGSGEATGAYYDPTTHVLLLKKDVKVHWEASTPNAKPMEFEAASAEYRESESQILLKPWGRMTRENTVVEGENAVVYLHDDAKGHKLIRKIDAALAHGTDSYPNRSLQYSADQVWVDYDDEGVVQKITAQDHARVVSASESSETTVTSDHVEMFFDSQNKESVLSHANCNGHSVISSKPLPGPGRQPTETHVLRSDALEMKMRPGGHEIATVVAHSQGNLEFLPNLPSQHHRTLDGKDIVINYGPQNRVDSFRAVDARTTTDPNADEVKRHRVGSTTTSRELVAHFNPKNSQLSSMEQTGDFAYDEGDRKARAAKASLDSDQNVILLDGAARMWDATGSTSADHIRMDQKTGDYTADGHINSSRLPEKDQKKNSQMLSGDEPLQAQARKMSSANHNRSLHYEGDVTMWQGANRIQADSVDVDREKRRLEARGNVVSSLWEEPKDEEKKKTATPVLTVVHAPHLVYTDDNRLAIYEGGVLLNRTGLQVKSKELRAYLADADADSRLEKAFADGSVEIVQTAKGRTRTGTSDHGEYYTDDQKVFLSGGKPQLIDSLKKDAMRCPELTYFANDDRLLGSGTSSDPCASRLHRGK